MSNTAYLHQIIAQARETIRVAERALKAEQPKPRKATAEKVVADRRARIAKKTAATCAK